MNEINIEGKKFVPVYKSSELFEKKGVKIQFPGDDDFQLALFKVNNKIYCLENICPHRHADRIFEGIIKDLTVMCPLHGWTYSLETGDNINQRQGIKHLRKYPVIEIDGIIYVEEPEFQIPKWRR